ncbi:MAG TPA: glycosyltransferase family 2 protein [Acetobacteraceae bacterium]|nr:glycosyltransferase family 2 protein [Acetobacteraceae bacterium]
MTGRPACRSRLVLIPSYDTGPRLAETVRAALDAWSPVWVVVDGSTDGSDAALGTPAAGITGLRVLRLPANRGKGAAVRHGLLAAQAAGFTHALTMDADGQHPAASIAPFMAASAASPDAMILGRPVFDASAPALRVRGRRISNWFADAETLRAGIGDCLCGFRVYPIAPLLAVMASTRWMRRFDFDPEAAVRLCWRGVRPVSLPVPVRYFAAEAGGVSHFRYGRDNLLLTWMHVRLVAGAAARLPVLLARRHRRG